MTHETSFRHVASAAWDAPSDTPSASARAEALAAIRRWQSSILDQIDYGVVLASGDLRVLYANEAALSTLDERHPLQLRDGTLHPRRGDDFVAIRKAVSAASTRGLRTLLMLSDGAERASVAVVPLPAAPGEDGMALLVIGKRSVCEELSAQWYARWHGLTLAESQVLRLLCGGAAPNEIARRQGVAISTIRTQIGSIRAKTGMRTIGDLLREVAVLPPLVRVLHAGVATA